VISLYGCYLCVYLIKDKASVIGIDKGYAFNRYTRQYESIDIKKYLLIMFNEEPILCALVLFLGASALVVIGFAGYQSFLSGVNGMTTNELAKWGRLEGRLERGETFITKTYVGDQVDEGVKSAKEKTSENTDINTNNSDNNNSDNNSDINNNNNNNNNNEGVRKRKGIHAKDISKSKDKDKDKSKTSALGMEEFYEGIIKNGYRYTTISKVEDLNNLYNYGIKANFKEIIFPEESIFE